MRSKSMLVEWTRQSRSCREKFSVGGEGVDMFFCSRGGARLRFVWVIDGPYNDAVAL